MPAPIAVAGTLFMVFYISVLTTTLGPFQCENNPNRMLADRRARTQDSDFLRCLNGAISILGWLHLDGDSLSHQDAFGGQTSCDHSHFYLPGSGHGAYWFSLAHMLRSLARALPPVIPSTVAQLLDSQLTMIGYLICISHVLPWRDGVANALDTLLAVSFVDPILSLFFIYAYAVIYTCSVSAHL